MRPAGLRAPVFVGGRIEKASAVGAQLCELALRGHYASTGSVRHAHEMHRARLQTPTRSSTLSTAGERPTSMHHHQVAPGASRSCRLRAPHPKAPPARHTRSVATTSLRNVPPAAEKHPCPRGLPHRWTTPLRRPTRGSRLRSHRAAAGRSRNQPLCTLAVRLLCRHRLRHQGIRRCRYSTTRPLPDVPPHP